MKQEYVEADVVKSDNDRAKKKGKRTVDLSSGKAIVHVIGDKVELWQGNYTAWRLLGYVLQHDETGVSFNWGAMDYIRRHKGIALTAHRETLISEAMKMINEHIASKVRSGHSETISRSASNKGYGKVIG